MFKLSDIKLNHVHLCAAISPVGAKDKESFDECNQALGNPVNCAQKVGLLVLAAKSVASHLQ